MDNSCNTPLPPNKETRSCNCKYSKCLKLYCECFSSGNYCKDCSCLNCFNIPEHEETRDRKVKIILVRDPLAFCPKIPLDPRTLSFQPAPHFKGCNCRKTKCVKKYCECYNVGILCCESCKCSHCKNKASKEPTSKKPQDPLFYYFKALSGGLKMENEEEFKSDGSITASDESVIRSSENKNFERFEEHFFDKILDILNSIRSF